MNNILITNQPPEPLPAQTYRLSYLDADSMLPILRGDHFRTITLHHAAAISLPQLRFAVQFARLLTSEVPHSPLRER